MHRPGRALVTTCPPPPPSLGEVWALATSEILGLRVGVRVHRSRLWHASSFPIVAVMPPVPFL